MKIIYLTWGETPRLNGVYGSQVLGQINRISKLDKSIDISLYCGLPLINSGLVRRTLSYFSDIRKIRVSLPQKSLNIIPILGVQTEFYPSGRFGFNGFHLLSNFLLRNRLKKDKPDIVHCRSYHAAYAALIARAKLGLNYKVIFDARGLWPEEAVLKNKVVNGSPQYRFLKEVEMFVLNSADITISVSDPMSLHFEKIGAKRVETIYLSSDVNSLRPKLIERGSSDEKVLCYVGALSDDTWHKPYILMNTYRAFRKAYAKTKLLIVTQSNKNKIMAQALEFPESEIYITSTNNSEELATLLSTADFGVLPYLHPKEDHEIQIASTIMAVKTAEYLSAGLPVLVNKYCGGAATIANKFNVGLTFDPINCEDSINNYMLDHFLRSEFSDHAIDVAKKCFDYTKNAENYIALYQELMAK